jgi:hypothetical protein
MKPSLKILYYTTGLVILIQSAMTTVIAAIWAVLVA